MKVYYNEPHKLGFERGESWVRFDALNGRISIESCNYDGDPDLSPAQVKRVIEWMQAAITHKGNAQKATKGKASK